MKDIKPFQIFDVLSQDDFTKVLTEKFNFIPKGQGLKNIKLQLKHSEQKIGVFSKLCTKIEGILTEKGFEDPKVLSIDFINQSQRKHMPFHRHWLWEGIDPYKEHKNYQPKPESIGKSRLAIPYEYFWIAIYYPHDLYDFDYHGTLTVKKEPEDTDVYQFKAVPNSIVMHNGLYGHEVNINKADPSKLRDSCFTEWVCLYKA